MFPYNSFSSSSHDKILNQTYLAIIKYNHKRRRRLCCIPTKYRKFLSRKMSFNFVLFFF